MEKRCVAVEEVREREDEIHEGESGPKALVKRLKEYHGQTVPILKHYAPGGVVETVNANQGMAGVFTEIQGALKGTQKK